MIVNNTPVEKHQLAGWDVWVKREDLCTSPPGPPFSKCRGLQAHMLKLKKRGVSIVGYAESAISMAGWGVAWMAQELGMTCYIFNPVYKNKTPIVLEKHRRKWAEFGAQVVDLPAGRTAVNYYIGRNWLHKKTEGKGVMLPIGLRLPESVEETAREWQRLPKFVQGGTTTVCVGSGTITAGILRGWKPGQGQIEGIMSHQGDPLRKYKEIMTKAGWAGGPDLFHQKSPLHIVPSQWEYVDSVQTAAPFPCNMFYDRKTWQWLELNITRLKPPVLFWNIGGM